MADPVKRTYSSALRAAHARETRRSIVSTAARLFTERGYGRTTIDAIADQAGVSRKTVFTAVGGKLDLLKLALDWAVTGDDEPIPLQERLDEMHTTRTATSPDAILRSWVDVVAPIAARVHGLSAALAAAAAADEDARRLREVNQSQRLSGAHAFVTHLSAHHGLRPGLAIDRAADIVWLYSDPTIYHRLVTERGWADTDYRGWLLRTINQQLRH
jgi:AcrR family transcriptional regulator